MNMPHRFCRHHSLLLDPAVQKSQEPEANIVADEMSIPDRRERNRAAMA